jgi:hypothetical protein
LIGQGCDSPIAFLKIAEADTDHDRAKQGVVGAVDAPAKSDELRSVQATDESIADVDTVIVGVAEVLKVGTI